MSDIKRLEIGGVGGGGAILYRPAVAGNLAVPWFEYRYWLARDAVVESDERAFQTVVLDEAGRRLVLSQYHREGVATGAFVDRFLWRGAAASRPFSELLMLDQLSTAGLPVPVPLAARYLRDGLFYRGSLLTACIADAKSLRARLLAGGVSLAGWAAIGRALRRLHDFGVHHAGLHVNRILLRGDDEVTLAGFDRSRFRRPGLWRDADLVQLRRSIETLGDGQRQAFDEVAWHCLLSAYSQVDAPVASPF